MLRGYRCIVIAALGWLSLAASPPPETKGNQSATQAQTSRDLERIAAALESFKAPDKDTGCQSGQNNRQSDLCAQWKAADAAHYTMWAGIVGLIAGFTTLFFAWRAAHWAKQAAAETKRSADAAENMHVSFVQAERAVLHVTSGMTAIISEKKVVSFRMLNRGRTPARVNAFQTRGVGEKNWTLAAPRWTIIKPDCEGSIVGFDCPPDTEEGGQIECRVIYQSVGARTHTSHFFVNFNFDNGPYQQGWVIGVMNENGHPADT